MPGSADDTVAERGPLELVINGVYVTNDFAFWTSARLRQNKFTHIVYVDRKAPALQGETLDPNEFECLELNFNLALVLPNLYKSDKFIAKALENEGKVLILEPISCSQQRVEASNQKGIAIILGYLMYKFELSIYDAYEALRKIYRTNFELDRFLIMQLYEYEPILEVHRAAEEMGHSRSGERLRSVLKRASCVLDTSYEETTTATGDDDDYSLNHHHPEQSPSVLLVTTSSQDDEATGREEDALLNSINRSSSRMTPVDIETMVE